MPLVHDAKNPLQHLDAVQRSLPQHPVVSVHAPPVGAQHLREPLQYDGAQHSEEAEVQVAPTGWQASHFDEVPHTFVPQHVPLS